MGTNRRGLVAAVIEVRAAKYATEIDLGSLSKQILDRRNQIQRKSIFIRAEEYVHYMEVRFLNLLTGREESLAAGIKVNYIRQIKQFNPLAIK